MNITKLVSVLVALGAALAAYWSLVLREESVPDLTIPGVRTFSPTVKFEPFELIDHNGREFTNSSLAGQWSVVFFGYTSCPDACPTTLTVMKAVDKTLRESTRKDGLPQFVFLSVDPIRDKQEKLREFVTYFNPEFVGVTGSKAQIDQFALHAGGIYDFEDRATHELIRDTSLLTEDGDYLVTHFAGLMIFNDKARMVAHILPPHDPERVIQVLNALRNG